MGQHSRADSLARTFVVAALVAVSLAGCAPAPVKPFGTHIGPEAPRPEGAIPAPVLMAPVVPLPTAATRPETYSVVVNNVRVQDLLFALARDAKLQIDIHPGIGGSVTLNAIDQTLPQLLNRISKQVDMRYEIDGPVLSVMRDTPYLRTYKIDYVSASRNVKMQSTSSTQFGGSAGSAGSAGTGSTATVDLQSNNQLWEQIVQNVKDVLQETDRVLPGAGGPAAQPPAAPAPAPGQAPAVQAAPPTQPNVNFREAAAVIANRESGVLFVRATSRQHEKVQEFLDQVLANTRRQVLVEATIAEVQLNNQYQRGIDWQRLRPPGATAGFQFSQSPAGTPAGVSTTGGMIVNYLSGPGLNVVLNALKLLEAFGDVRVLSSPKISVLNNQVALLRVTRDIVYFTITPSTTPVTIAGTGIGGVTVQQAFSTTPNVAAEGFMMTVLPQISDADSVVLNVRPTIRRQVDFANDPNPALTLANPNKIPVFETREFDSILRLQSGQTAVLGGLMQESLANLEDTIPGVNRVPGVGEFLAQRDQKLRKSELVVFLRSTVIHDATLAGDYRQFQELLPKEDFFSRPNPARDPAPR